MLTERQTFKAAMLAACADSGLDTQQSTQAIRSLTEITKQAQGVGGLAAMGGAAAWDLAKSLGKGGVKGLSALSAAASPPVLGALLFGPPALGAAVGYGVGKLPQLEEDSPEEVKNRELIDQMRLYAERAKYNRIMKDFRRSQAPRRGGRPLLA